MCETYAEATVRDDFTQSGRDRERCLGSRSRLCAASILALHGCSSRSEGDVEVALDELEVGRELAEEGVDGGGGEVAEAEDLADFARCEEFLELRAVVSAVLNLDVGRRVELYVGVVPLRVCPSPSRQPGGRS